MVVREIGAHSKSISSINQPRQQGVAAQSYAGGCGSQAALAHHTARTQILAHLHAWRVGKDFLCKSLSVRTREKQ